jgi:hypothetical protein
MYSSEPGGAGAFEADDEAADEDFADALVTLACTFFLGASSVLSFLGADGFDGLERFAELSSDTA